MIGTVEPADLFGLPFIALLELIPTEDQLQYILGVAYTGKLLYQEKELKAKFLGGLNHGAFTIIVPSDELQVFQVGLPGCLKLRLKQSAILMIVGGVAITLSTGLIMVVKARHSTAHEVAERCRTGIVGLAVDPSKLALAIVMAVVVGNPRPSVEG